jgi:LysM repeat protein
VRAGDTLSAIAARTHTPLVRLRQLNPGLQPTALFIGQRIRLR